MTRRTAYSRRVSVTVEGYRLTAEPTGAAAGRPWSGHRSSDGISVRAVRYPGRAAELVELRRRWQVVRGLGEPALTLPLELVTDGADLIVVEQADTDPRLDEVLVAEGPMDADGVLELVGRLGRVLGRCHDENLVHGALSPLVLSVGEHGVLLGGLVVSRPVSDAVSGVAYADLAESGPPGPAGDTYAVAAIAYFCLTGRAPWPGSPLVAPPHTPPDRAKLIGRIAAVLEADVRDRPAIRNLVVALRPPAPPKPATVDPVVELLRAAPALTNRPAPRVRRHQQARTRPSGRRRTALVVAVLLLVLGALVWVTRSPGRPAEVANPSTAGSPTVAAAASEPTTDVADVHSAGDWTSYLEELYAARARAFTLPSVRPLNSVFAPGSPALQADEASVRQLARAGGRLVGFAPVVVRVLVVQVAGPTVTLRVVDRIPAYQESAAPATLTSRPGRGPATVVLSLQRAGERWLIVSAAREG